MDASSQPRSFAPSSTWCSPRGRACPASRCRSASARRCRSQRRSLWSSCSAGWGELAVRAACPRSSARCPTCPARRIRRGRPRRRAGCHVDLCGHVGRLRRSGRRGRDTPADRHGNHGRATSHQKQLDLRSNASTGLPGNLQTGVIGSHRRIDHHALGGAKIGRVVATQLPLQAGHVAKAFDTRRQRLGRGRVTDRYNRALFGQEPCRGHSPAVMSQAHDNGGAKRRSTRGPSRHGVAS